MNAYYMSCTLIYSSKNPVNQDLFSSLHRDSLEIEALAQVPKFTKAVLYGKAGILDIILPEALPHYLTLKLKVCELFVPNIKMQFSSIYS